MCNFNLMWLTNRMSSPYCGMRSCHLTKAFAKSSLGMVFSSRPHSCRERESCCVCVSCVDSLCVAGPMTCSGRTDQTGSEDGGSGKDDFHITASGLFFIFTQPRYYMYFPRYCIIPVKFGTHLVGAAGAKYNLMSPI
jgi:hypothetical protein